MTFKAQGSLGWKDYLSWILNHNKYLGFLYVALWSAFASHVIQRFFLNSEGFPSLQWLLLALFLYVALFSLMLFSYLWRIRRQPAAYERITCLITEEGITYEQEHQTWWVQWDHIQKVISTNQHIFLLLDIRIPLIIPKRFFADEKAAAEAAALIQKSAGKISEEKLAASQMAAHYTVTGKLRVYEYYLFVLKRSKRLLLLALVLSATATSFWEFPGYIIWIYRWVLLRNWAIYFGQVLPLLYVPFLFLQTVRLWKAKPLRKTVYLFTEDELVVQAEDTQRKFAWSSVRKVTSSRWALSISFPGKGTIFLPRRYFADRQEQKAVTGFVREKVSQRKRELRSASNIK